MKSFPNLKLTFFLSAGLMLVSCLGMAQAVDKNQTDDAITPAVNLTDTLGNAQPFDPSPNDEFLKSISLIQIDADMQRQIDLGEVRLASKRYSKTYTAGKMDELAIDNRFGEVKINTWDKPEFKVEVQVNIYADKQSDAQSFLPLVNVFDTKKDALVAFKTIIGDTRGSDRLLWTANGQPHLKKIEINYVVYMPAKNSLNISNSYGNVILPDFNGRLLLKSTYSSLKAQRLNNPLNQVKVSFGNASIESFSGSKLEISYGSLDLMEGDDLNATISYGQARIGKLYSSANISVRFGKELNIGGLDKKLKSLNITSDYTAVKLGNVTQMNASYDVTTNYGILKTDDPSLKILAKLADNSSDLNSAKNYKGQLGKGNASCNIVITSKFGFVSFNKPIKNGDEPKHPSPIKISSNL
ncbi:hypothetical protein AAFN85_20145 [Mucilaginibacter sp. CAU 1740]|uniref:hypothetical protein n=1 Tax=Mucilaginibacter sp. CAU 1740 TaxID=3140365 RepID=UPI00325AEDD1